MSIAKWTAPKIRSLKGNQKVVCLTAYDCTFARWMDEAGVPLILVGDSLGMTVLGYGSTLPVTLDQMLHHTAAVCRGVTSAMVITDMPFMSYQVSVQQALENAGRCLQEGGADGVKLEGGKIRAESIRALVDNGIPVLGHIGLLPQSVKAMGGYRVQGKTEEAARQLIEEAKAVEDAGAFALVLEAMPPSVAQAITEAVSLPTIGIGAGRSCDGQVLVINDLLGLTDKPPKFAKAYAKLGEETRRAIAAYRDEVQSGAFPGDEQTYGA
ncbi:MAG: 3-methyl-2-oxobutanoate hydroxymethyltransferase [Verrucomicrobia bacterium]|nr:3-methyl-2-oxobutanoate hydroxymethyltransferase [Verrucomicrobiota bacterium]